MNPERNAAKSYGGAHVPNAAKTLHETKGDQFQKAKTKLKRTDFKGKINPGAGSGFIKY